jgi:hypothetical protein
VAFSFETSSEDPRLNAVVITAGPAPLRATGIQQVLEPWNGIA